MKFWTWSGKLSRLACNKCRDAANYKKIDVSTRAKYMALTFNENVRSLCAYILVVCKSNGD